MHVNTSNARQRTEQTEGYIEQTNDQNKKQVRQISQTMSIHDNEIMLRNHRNKKETVESELQTKSEKKAKQKPC